MSSNKRRSINYHSDWDSEELDEDDNVYMPKQGRKSRIILSSSESEDQSMDNESEDYEDGANGADRGKSSDNGMYHNLSQCMHKSSSAIELRYLIE